MPSPARWPPPHCAAGRRTPHLASRAPPRHRRVVSFGACGRDGKGEGWGGGGGGGLGGELKPSEGARRTSGEAPQRGIVGACANGLQPRSGEGPSAQSEDDDVAPALGGRDSHAEEEATREGGREDAHLVRVRLGLGLGEGHILGL